MGLLLSILVFSVGVMEVIACIRHIQYGYLPEWAPRRHVFATGTSGITKLREHWRKKPSKSVGYDNKTKINRHDVTRSCDIPCYGDECQELVNSCVQSEKLKSPLQQVKDACAANFRPLTSEVGEFNLTYQEFEEVLPRGANTFSELEDSTINQDHALCNNSLQDVSAQIAENRGSKIDQIQSDFDYSLPYHENIVVEEQRFPASGLQSPSPLRSKVDISWPLSTPHSLISRRPSTPTTAEEDGGQSPYYGGEFLTEEHIKSTQRPLSIRTDTYHCDQDITPIFVDDTDVDGAVSVNRPLTIASRADEFQTALNVDNECANIIPKNNVEIIRDTPSALNIGTHTSSLEACNAYTLQNTDTENTMITKSEEAKALELCINQKRRTSKTEYLPHSEELATTILQKELTSEISFAAKKEEPTHLNPTKATSFEEARVESFEAEPLYIGVSEPVHNEARRSSIISTINLDDVSVISGSLQIKAPDDPITLAKTIENEDSVMSKTQQEKNVVKRKGVKFNDPDVSDLEDEIPRFDEKETYIKFDISPRKETIDKYDIRRLVEITAMTLVDEIVEEAIERLIGNHNSSEEDEEWRTEETEVPGKFADRECVRNGQLVKLHDESSFKLDNTLVVQDTKVTNTVPDTSSKNLAENTSRLCALDDTEQDNGKVNKSPLLVTKSKFTENINDDNAYSKNDSGETKILEENTSKKSKLTNTLESQQEDETQFNISASFLTPTTSLTDSEKVVEGGIASEYDTSRPSKTHGEIITEKDELSIAECSSSSSSSLAKSVGVTESSSKNSSANIPVTRDDAISDQASAGQSKGSEKIEKTSTQQPGQQPSKQAPEAFWLIFSGEYTKAMSKDWHSGHFCCWQCDESLTGQRYVLRDDHPYCIKCYESVFANTCEECNRTIGIDSKDLSYKDKHWHEACFLCTKCRVSLVDKQFGSKADKIYCGNCYDSQFASRCDGCGEIFRAGTKKMEYKTRQWHEKCFCCCVCKTAIGTKSFIPREQEIYCANCYEEKFATRCVKCNKIITSGGVTYKNEPWHRECFTCTNCNTSLAGQRFTSRDEKPYCADCFGELFAKRCTSCSRPITGIGGTRFISFEDRHWHNDCFICASCKTSLVGRGFITDGDDIICPDCAKQKLM